MTENNSGRIERLGLFGGTFAPPHLGHINALRVLLKNVKLDRVLVMPTYMSPHKSRDAADTPEQRFRMCKSAFSGISGVEVSDFEIKKGGISYTAETLEHLKTEQNKIFLLCGSDMFLTLDKWYHSREIFEKAAIVCIPRYSGDRAELDKKREEYENNYKAEIIFAGENPLEMSSTEVREAILGGEKLEKYLPAGVIEIIKKEKLYLK